MCSCHFCLAIQCSQKSAKFGQKAKSQIRDFCWSNFRHYNETIVAKLWQLIWQLTSFLCKFSYYARKCLWRRFFCHSQKAESFFPLLTRLLFIKSGPMKSFVKKYDFLSKYGATKEKDKIRAD